MSAVSYRIDSPAKTAAYVFDFLFVTLGITAEPAHRRSGGASTADGPVDVYYGNETDVSCRVRIPYNPNDLLWADLLDRRVTTGEIGQQLPFDLINAIGALLTDRVNEDAPPEAFDLHDRLVFEGSFQAASGFGHVPIVNRYVDFLREVFERRLNVTGRPLWPDGKTSAIALTHDVDAPMRHGASGGPWYDPKASFKRNTLTNLYRAKWTVERAFGANGLEHWHFPLIMDAESVRGFKSSFMFAVTRRFDRDGHPDFDVSYDVQASRFTDLFKQLSFRDFEIGLHAGYNAFQSLGLLEGEKEKLERLCGLLVRGLRHHAWHTGRDVSAALEAHEEAGFEFDSSIAFNRRAKLRRSVALPYRPWSGRLGRAIDVLQIPVALMDGHIFYHEVTPDSAIRQAKAAVDMIRDSGGAGAVDWHVRTSSPNSRQFGLWGKTYGALLDYLADQGDIWVTSLGEINDWIRVREKEVRGSGF